MSAQEDRPFVHSEHVRLGIVLAPDGSPQEAEGVLNPAVVRDREGALLMFPRMVAAGNVSRIGIVRLHERGDEVEPERCGIVLEGKTLYERRAVAGGFGCEDPRITFVPRLDAYVMTYTAFGPLGPKIALAISRDAYAWTRLGLLAFDDDELNHRPNKDAAFFPEPVRTPSGELAFALYHRPMLASSANGQAPVSVILGLEPHSREVTCIGYIPLAAALADPANLCRVAASVPVLGVDARWGWLKNGCGTPPIRTLDGWLSFFHGVDAGQSDGGPALLYRAGIVLHDLERPDRVLFRSPFPVLGPLTPDERFGTVDDVVFPTGIDVRGPGVYDVYYGAADAKIARARFTVDVAY